MAGELVRRDQRQAMQPATAQGPSPLTRREKARAFLGALNRFRNPLLEVSCRALERGGLGDEERSRHLARVVKSGTGAQVREAFRQAEAERIGRAGANPYREAAVPVSVPSRLETRLAAAYVKATDRRGVATEIAIRSLGVAFFAGMCTADLKCIMAFAAGGNALSGWGGLWLPVAPFLALGGISALCAIVYDIGKSVEGGTFRENLRELKRELFALPEKTGKQDLRSMLEYEGKGGLANKLLADGAPKGAQALPEASSATAALPERAGGNE